MLPSEDVPCQKTTKYLNIPFLLKFFLRQISLLWSAAAAVDTIMVITFSYFRSNDSKIRI